MAGQSPDPVVADQMRVSPWGLVAAGGVSLSAFILFALFLPGWGHLVLVASVQLGAVLTAAVLVPLMLDRWWLKRRAIVYPWRTGKSWNRVQWSYVVAVPLLGWAVLPAYFIHSGAYQNWPAVHGASELARFFVGVNFVCLWDELFSICTCFALLQGWIFNRTRNLTYVVAVHLLFDVIVFVAIVHAHNPEWLRVFVH